MQFQLFPGNEAVGRTQARVLSSAPAHVAYYERWLARPDADRYFTLLLETVPWERREVTMYGKRVAVPRLSAWYGDPSAFYTFSNRELHPLPWTDELSELREEAQRITGYSYNSVLLNRYRNGMDSVAWHADDESELGANPAIASISLGTPRTFAMRSNDRSRSFSLLLAHGSLLLMSGQTQRLYRHAVPKEPRIAGERLNLTFRTIRA